MSFYSDASLVMIPSGYKDQKVYSAVPTDGSGDLVFSRASGATRVGPDGLIEKVRTNLQTYSQDFSNAIWSKSAGATLTHSQTDPNGGTTASRLQMPSGTTNYFGSSFSGATNGGKYTHSIYMKSNTGSTQSVRIIDGVRGVAGGSLIASVTTSWQRFEVVITTASTSAGLQLDNNGGAYNNDILIAFAQSEESDFGATNYIATTSAAVSVGPVSGLPRLDYLGSTCPRLLLEPSRTNSQRASEQLDNASFWSVGGGTISANLAVSPDGYQNADKFVESATTARHELYNDTLAFSGTSSVSIFAKAAGRRYFSAITGGDPSLGGATFDLQTGTISATSGGTSASITAMGNDWYRCTFTTTRSNSSQVYFCLRTTGGTPNVETYAGDGTSGILFWGCQVELAQAYPTSYVNTLGSSVTRVAEVASKTGITSLIGQTEGTLFVDFDFNGNYDANGIVAMDVLGAGSNEAYIFVTGGGQLRLELYVGGAIQALITTSIGAVGRKKIAFGYKQNDFVGYMNGVQVGTDISGTVGSMNTIYIGTYQSPTYATGNINQALVFKTRLSNTALAELTA